MITLTLTEGQAEILGYALIKAWRAERDKADAARNGSDHKAGCRDRQYQIDELRNILDAA